MGDAVMATFNRAGDRADHAADAVRAAVALQEETGRIAAENPDWPRFRVGVNTGTALVCLLGAAGGRTHTVIGDTVNVAARLEGLAPAGGIALGAETARRVAGGAHGAARPGRAEGARRDGRGPAARRARIRPHPSRVRLTGVVDRRQAHLGVSGGAPAQLGRVGAHPQQVGPRVKGSPSGPGRKSRQ